MTAPAIINVAELRVRPGPPAHPGGGESDGLYRLSDQPGVLFKRYTPNAARRAGKIDLDRLIAQPLALGDQDATLARDATAWPFCRVEQGGNTVGVLLPEAPEKFKVAWHGAVTRDSIRVSLLEIDMLAKPNHFLAARGIPAQHVEARMDICQDLVRIADLFERCGIVYADWSYSNAFWHPLSRSVYLIDLDSATYGNRRYVTSPGFEDPLTPYPMSVDSYVDRYRLALLVGRCLTGVRDPGVVIATLRSMPGPVPATLERMLAAPSRLDRPSMANLARAFGLPGSPAESRPAAAGQDSGVVDRQPRQVRPTPSSNPAPAAELGQMQPAPLARRRSTRQILFIGALLTIGLLLLAFSGSFVSMSLR